jgi:AcrR family transcriptional regulator
LARPLSELKRVAILESAANVIAESGLGGSVARIAKGAGVAEGTIFVYFSDKDVLINELYLTIKADLAGSLGNYCASSGSIKARTEQIWNRYIEWGASHGLKRKAMSQLTVSDRVTEATRKKADAYFVDIKRIMVSLLAEGPLKRQSFVFALSIMEAIAETTLTHIARSPQQSDNYRRAGFLALWGAISGG